MKRVSHDGVSPEIPTSSMADVAFLLILFFMVTSVFSASGGLDMRLPPPVENGEPQPAIVIQVRAGEIRLDCRPAELAAILPYLEARLARNPGKPVVLWAAPDASYEEFIEVYDRLALTREPDSPWGFRIDHLSVPTAADIAAYVETFGVDPYACAD